MLNLIDSLTINRLTSNGLYSLVHVNKCWTSLQVKLGLKKHKN